MPFTNPYNLPIGTICVLRMHAGKQLALSIPQHQYKEYNGCFSIISNDRY